MARSPPPKPPLPETGWIWQLDRARRTALFQAHDSDIRAELPSDPMHGTVGVAPANSEVRSALVPDTHGGNAETRTHPRYVPASPATSA